MHETLRGRVETFWQLRLGCPPSSLREPGLHLREASEPASVYVVALEEAEAVVVRAPPELHETLRAIPPERLLDPSALAAVLPPPTRLVGPAFVGYAHELAQPSEPVERVETARDPRFDALRTALPPEAWRHANLDAASPPIFAVTSGGSVIAASGAEILAGAIAHLGVATHPAHRGRGLARRVVAAAGAAAAARGLVLQYQTLLSNAPALAVGRALGFERFATTLAARWPASPGRDG